MDIQKILSKVLPNSSPKGNEKKSIYSLNDKQPKKAKDKYSLIKSQNRMLFYIPYRYFIDEGQTLLLKNGGFMRVYKIENRDLSFVDNFQGIIDSLNRAIMKAGSGIVLHYETQKIPKDKIKENISEFSPIPTMLFQETREEKFKSYNFYDINHYLTISYFYDYNKEKSLDEIVALGKKKVSKKNYIKENTKLYKEYDGKVKDIIYALKSSLISEPKPLVNSELMNFLYKTINPMVSKVNLKTPPKLYPLDEFLSDSQIINKNGILNIEGYFTKTISIKLFADKVIPQIFGDLEKLPFPFRSVTRLIALSKEEAIKTIKNIEKYQYGKRFNFFQIALNAVNGGKKVDNGDETRILKSKEAKAARYELQMNQVSYGYYTFSVIVGGKTIEEAEGRADEVRRLIGEFGFTAKDDKYNAIDVYFGAMPGNIKQNVRMAPMDSKALSDMLPLSSVYEGDPWDKKFEAPNLFTTMSDDRIFYFNNKVSGDVGHTMILGRTGSGKSTLLGLMEASFLKYGSTFEDARGKKHKIGSQVFVFDKGASSKVLTLTSGGKFYDLGAEAHAAFQPLRNIHLNATMEWAFDWVCLIIGQEMPSLVENVHKREKIRDALLSLATMDPDDRTISRLTMLVNDNELRAALQNYCQEGAYGSYFDNIDPGVESANITTFEMGEIMEKPKVVTPILDYLFHVIQTQKTNKGIPTLIVLDECWVFFRNEMMANKIAEWLKVLRKQNATVGFATQNIEDIDNSTIAGPVKNACMTKIFLPDTEQGTATELYKSYGLSEKAIWTIRNSTPKMDYLYTSEYGVRLFQLMLDPIQLAYVGVSDQEGLNKIGNLAKTYKENSKDDVEYIKKLNQAWLAYIMQRRQMNSFEYDNAKHLIEKYNLITERDDLLI